MSTTKMITDAIKDASKAKTKGYDTTATVKRVEGSTVWVHIPGGVDETPVKRTINAGIGDTVQVRVSDGSAWLVGNASAPPTDDTRANSAMVVATDANALADSASKAATKAWGYAEDARSAAATAETHADEAKASAENASEYAARALGNLSTVQNVTETLNWITAHGTMTLTTDVALDPTHVYFVVDPLGDYEVGGTHYSVVTEPDVANIGTYYELSIDESLNNYVGTHLALTSEGLWLIPEAGGNRVLIATGGVGHTYEDAGTYILDGNDNVVAQFLENGAQIGNTNGAHALIDINGFSAHNRESVKFFDVDFDGGSITRNNDIEYASTSATKTIRDSEITLVSDTAPISSSIPNGTTVSINTYYPQLVISQLGVGTSIGVTITQSDGLTAVGDVELRGVRPPQSTELSFSIGTSSTIIDGYVVVNRGSGTVRFSYKLEYDAVNNCLKSTCTALPNNNGQTIYTTVGVYVRINYGYSVTTTAPAYTIGIRTQGYGIGNFSAVIGDNLVAEDEYQLSIGKYNDNQSTNAFEIGNGTSDNARSNALTVDWGGDVCLALDTTAASGTDHDLYAAITALGWQSDVIV